MRRFVEIYPHEATVERTGTVPLKMKLRQREWEPRRGGKRRS